MSEKDFLARKDMKYVCLVDSPVSHFNTLLANCGSIERSAELASAMREYADSFHDLIADHREHGLDENEEVQEKFRTSAHSIEAAVQKHLMVRLQDSNA